jgi:hypothetical protein
VTLNKRLQPQHQQKNRNKYHKPNLIGIHNFGSLVIRYFKVW